MSDPLTDRTGKHYPRRTEEGWGEQPSYERREVMGKLGEEGQRIMESAMAYAQARLELASAIIVNNKDRISFSRQNADFVLERLQEKISALEAQATKGVKTP